MSGIYNSVSGLGELRSSLGLYIGGGVAIILGIVAIVFAFKNQSDLIDTTAIVTQVTCKPKDSKKYDCDLTVSFSINEKQYTGNFSMTSDKLLAQNDTILVSYNKTNPTIVTAKVTRNTSIALILGIVAVVLFAAVYLNYYLTHRYKIYAAAQGTETIFDLLKR
jgi:hypothetical protein